MSGFGNGTGGAFSVTPEGYKAAIQYLRDTGRDDLLRTELSKPDFSVVHTANRCHAEDYAKRFTETGSRS